jgi:hypothetical protein
MSETTTPPWPTHANGRQKTMGEMTRAEQDVQLEKIVAELQTELEGPTSPFRLLLLRTPPEVA